jgi:hypothetical protein
MLTFVSSFFGPWLVSAAELVDLAVLLTLLAVGWLLSGAGLLQLAKPKASKALVTKINPFFILVSPLFDLIITHCAQKGKRQAKRPAVGWPLFFLCIR